MRDMAAIVRRSPVPLAGSDGTGKPSIKKNEILFNGKAPSDDHETFWFPGEPGFNFCKTAQKPYDLVVTACLAVAKDVFGSEIEVSSDGDAADWEDGVELASRVLGRKIANPIGGGDLGDGIDIADEHRRSLIELGWDVGPMKREGDVTSFRVVLPNGLEQTRSFYPDGSMEVTRHYTKADAERAGSVPDRKISSQLYDELVEAGVPLDSHESDLYVLDVPAARKILERYPLERKNARRFRSEMDGKVWIDVPFAYAPWWRKRRKR